MREITLKGYKVAILEKRANRRSKIIIQKLKGLPSKAIEKLELKNS